jgi:hypothetical protein
MYKQILSIKKKPSLRMVLKIIFYWFFYSSNNFTTSFEDEPGFCADGAPQIDSY